jgi:hypothetical protein
MEARDIIMTLLAFLNAGLGWVLRVIWSKTEKTQDALNTFKTYVADEYVKQSRLETLETKIMAKLDRIEEKLDLKADK